MLERKPYAPPPTAAGAPALRDPYAAFGFRAYALYALGNFIAITGRQMLTISIEWEVYARTHSVTALGLVGLAAALPIVALSLPAGHLAGRFRRKSIILWTQALSALCSISPALISWKHLDLPRLAILLRANDFLRAIATVFERHPTFHFDDLSLPLLYLVLLLSAAVRTFGWAARSSFFPTLPPMRHAGRALLWSVSGFGAATIVFGASRWFWLSLLMLFLTGVFDSMSVIVRQTLVQLLTPDEMRGRISAVNNIFIGTSNEFGAVESGLTAAVFGPVGISHRRRNRDDPGRARRRLQMAGNAQDQSAGEASGLTR
jgi:MFS family permease